MLLPFRSRPISNRHHGWSNSSMKNHRSITSSFLFLLLTIVPTTVIALSASFSSSNSASSTKTTTTTDKNNNAFGPRTTTTTTPTLPTLTPLQADRMTAHVRISSGVDFTPTGPNYGVSSVLASLSWYPRQSFSQNVLQFSLTPDSIDEPPTVDELKTLHANTNDAATTTNDDDDDDDEEYLYVRWKQLGDSANFDVLSLIETSNDIVPIRDKLPFPIPPQSIHPRVKKLYVDRVGKYADTSPELQALAHDITTNTDDLYRAIFLIAEWIHSHIEYSLDSMGLEIQTAAQVLQSGWGKCDEMSALFVSLCRSVGIPARFVSGWAYTDNTELFDSRWGGHVWAESYVGNEWIPVDVTYGQVGFVDAGHVVLQTSPDVVESNVEYNARGNDFQCLPPEPLDCTVTPQDLVTSSTSSSGYHTSPPPLIDISMSAPIQSVQFGSALVILATVRNHQDYYVSTKLELGKTESTQVIHGLDSYKGQGPSCGSSSSSSSKLILLEPHSIQMIPLVFRMLPSSNQHVSNSYQFPFVLQASGCKGCPKAELMITVSGYAPFLRPEDCLDDHGRVIIPGQQQQQQPPEPPPHAFDDDDETSFLGMPHPPWVYPPTVEVPPRFAHDVVRVHTPPTGMAMPPPPLEDVPPFDVGVDSVEATQYHPRNNPQPRYIVPPRRNNMYQPPNMAYQQSYYGNRRRDVLVDDVLPSSSLLSSDDRFIYYHHDDYFQVKPEHQARFYNYNNNNNDNPYYYYDNNNNDASPPNHIVPPRRNTWSVAAAPNEAFLPPMQRLYYYHEDDEDDLNHHHHHHRRAW
mmetsp:Transcript_3679/g.5753  ORF Transcript_3679/g.5753 Transcript_3679/m.5753 type:complete len:802 (+) Transcript_3679:147-2552(+)